MCKEITRLINFADYIDRGQFYVALYQRDFIWNYDKTKEFIQESIDSFKDNKSKVFCGTIYLKDKGSKLEIIDGQQRTTFLYIVNKIFNPYLLDSKKFLESNKKRDMDQEVELKKINEILSKTKKFEIDIEREDKTLEEKIGSKGNKIGKLHASLKEYLDSEFSNDEKNSFGGNKNNQLKYLIHFYTKLEIVEIKTDDYNTNDVFKSINSKGKKLTEWDLIRNDVYNYYGSDLNDKQTKDEIIRSLDEKLEDIEKQLKIKKEEFIQSYLIYKLKKNVKKSELSINFNDLTKIEGKNNVAQNLIEFIKKCHQCMLDWNANSESDFSNDFKWFFYIVNEMGATQIKIYSLALIFKKNDGFINSISDSIINLFFNFVNYVIVFNGRANIFGGYFESNMDYFMEMENENFDEDLMDSINSSEFYKENIKFLSSGDSIFKDKGKFHKNLYKLFIWAFSTGPNKEATLKFLNDQYEHVLPKSFKKHWKMDQVWNAVPDDEIREKYLEKVGNFLLLNKKLNNPLKNHSYQEKLKSYVNSNEKNYYHYLESIEHHKFNELHVKEIKEWTPEVIDKRTNYILENLRNKFIDSILVDEASILEIDKFDEKLKNSNADVFKSIVNFIDGKEWVSLSEIYEELIEEYKEDINNKRWENKDNFKSVIRRNIQENCIDSRWQKEDQNWIVKNPNKRGGYKLQSNPFN